MVLQEPRVEFVPIDLSINANTGSFCPESVEHYYNVGGGQYCRASQNDAEYCANWANDIDWDASTPTEAP